MFHPEPPRPPQLVREVLRPGRLPNKLVEALLYLLHVTKEGGGILSMEWHTGRGLHDFLGNLASRADPVPGFYGITLLGIDWDVTVNLLHYFLSIAVGLLLHFTVALRLPRVADRQGTPPSGRYPRGRLRALSCINYTVWVQAI